MNGRLEFVSALDENTRPTNMVTGNSGSLIGGTNNKNFAGQGSIGIAGTDNEIGTGAGQGFIGAGKNNSLGTVNSIIMGTQNVSVRAPAGNQNAGNVVVTAASDVHVSNGQSTVIGGSDVKITAPGTFSVGSNVAINHT